MISCNSGKDATAMASAAPRRKEMIRGQYAGSNEAMVGGLQPSIGDDLVGMAARREKGRTAATMDGPRRRSHDAMVHDRLPTRGKAIIS